MDDPNQTLYNTTKQKLLEGSRCSARRSPASTWTRIAKGRAVRLLPLRDAARHAHLRARREDDRRVSARAATPILRIPDATETNVRAVDLGVLGIIVPTVDDALEARQAAMFARFPPIARRSTGGGQAGSIWTPVIQKPKTFRQTINDNMLVIVMIETQEGVKNALEIASQPGVDVVIIDADFESFSIRAGQRRVRDLQTRVRNATYRRQVLGQCEPGFSVGNPLAADSRFHLGVPPK
jgi:4-hydroxy-2-oxoheptanedioate aldolase